MLQTLRDNRFDAKFFEYEFWLECNFPGAHVVQRGVMVDPAKIEAFHRRPRPTFSDRSLEIF